MNSQSIKFEKVIQTDSTESKLILFERLNSKLMEFMGSKEKYDKNIIQLDKEMGIIKFNQILNYDPKGNRSDDGTVKYQTNVYFKNGRFKIILNDFEHQGKGISLFMITDDSEYPHKKSNYLKFRKKAWLELKIYLNSEMPKTFLTMESLITTPTEMESDW